MFQALLDLYLLHGAVHLIFSDGPYFNGKLTFVLIGTCVDIGIGFSYEFAYGQYALVNRYSTRGIVHMFHYKQNISFKIKIVNLRYFRTFQ